MYVVIEYKWIAHQRVPFKVFGPFSRANAIAFQEGKPACAAMKLEDES